ncbi:MAG: SOS response-associated peptidase [Acidobacteriota bacterium]
MCGRYTLTQAGAVPDLFEISELRIVPRFNIAPSQESPVIRLDSEGRREGVFLRGGLIPHWMKEKPSGSPMINARVEGLETKPAFRAAFKYRRCLVPLVAKVHDRMPVILPPDGYTAWLDSGTEPMVRHRLLAPYDSEAMDFYPVSPRVNSPANDDEACIARWLPNASQ